MHKEGHAGLSLILFSPFIMLFNALNADLSYILITALLMVGLSSIPDLDLQWEIQHRGITHTIVFGLAVGIIFSLILGYAMGLLGVLMGFVSGFGATVSHLLGDALTYSPFKPFYPFSEKEIAYGVCSSGNKAANQALMTAGIALFVLSLIIA
jgi:membrane-bound metal-dependent hydrolase YbcI (DUF457 family)